jgi:hypothetical protein
MEVKGKIMMPSQGVHGIPGIPAGTHSGILHLDHVFFTNGVVHFGGMNLTNLELNK